jgi:hypothetical protein
MKVGLLGTGFGIAHAHIYQRPGAAMLGGPCPLLEPTHHRDGRVRYARIARYGSRSRLRSSTSIDTVGV